MYPLDKSNGNESIQPACCSLVMVGQDTMSTDTSNIKLFTSFFFLSLWLKLYLNMLVPFIQYWRCQRNHIVVKGVEV